VDGASAQPKGAGEANHDAKRARADAEKKEGGTSEREAKGAPKVDNKKRRNAAEAVE